MTVVTELITLHSSPFEMKNLFDEMKGLITNILIQSTRKMINKKIATCNVVFSKTSNTCILIGSYPPSHN